MAIPLASVGRHTAAAAVEADPKTGARLVQCIVAGSTNETGSIVGKLGHKPELADRVDAIKV